MKSLIHCLASLIFFSLNSFAQTPELLFPDFVLSIGVSTNQLYFVNNDTLYKSDGTILNTEAIKEIPSPYGNLQFTEYNGKTYFKSSDLNHYDQLWVTDGTSAGTNILAEINSNGDGCLSILGVFNNKLYFLGDDNIHGIELWVTDGTEAGTQMFLDINVGLEDGLSYSTSFSIFNNELIFQADDGIHGSELWKSDGTAANTTMFKDINSTIGSYPASFKIANNKLYFTAYDDLGTELWVTDGTSQGTQMVKDINPGSNGSSPMSITSYNGKIYFVTTNEYPYNLWVSDGTEAGTQIFQDSVSSPFVYNNHLYFGKVSGFTAPLYEFSVYKSDGTAQGTTLLIEINGGNSKGSPSSFTIADGRLYFLCNYDGNSGANYLNNDLWVTDGTPANTNLVTYSNGEIVNVFQYNSRMRELNGSLYFSSPDSLFKIRGTGLSIGDYINSDLNIAIFPNPTQSRLFIKSPLEIQTIEIYSALGTLIHIEKSNTFSIENLSPGIYFIHIKTKAGSSIERFIKQ